MIDVHFVLLSVAIALTGACTYAWSTIRGRTEPNRVSWLMWSVAPTLAFLSELRQGVGLQALATLMLGLGPLVVLAASFANPRSVWRLGAFDLGCGVASCVGLALWAATDNDTVALVAFIAADQLAGLPTLVKAWRAPTTESPSAYIAGVTATSLALATASPFSSSQVAFPLVVLAFDSTVLTLVLTRLGPRLAGQLRQDLPRQETERAIPARREVDHGER